MASEVPADRPSGMALEAWIRGMHAQVGEPLPEELATMWRHVVVGSVMREGWLVGEVLFVRFDENTRTSLLHARLDAGHILHLSFDNRKARWTVVAVVMPDGTAGPDTLVAALSIEDITKVQATEVVAKFPA